jgi:hypothetical protein
LLLNKRKVGRPGVGLASPAENGLSALPEMCQEGSVQIALDYGQTRSNPQQQRRAGDESGLLTKSAITLFENRVARVNERNGDLSPIVRSGILISSG